VSKECGKEGTECERKVARGEKTYGTGVGGKFSLNGSSNGYMMGKMTLWELARGGRKGTRRKGRRRIPEGTPTCE